MADGEYYHVQVGGYVKLMGKNIALSKAHVRYERNRIPEATIFLPVGRSMDTAFDVSDAQGLLTTLEPMTPIEVVASFQISADSGAAPKGKDPGFKNGDNTIFKGFVAGPAQDKSFEGATAALVIRAYGEPVGLAGSTAFTKGMTVQMGGSGGNRAPVRMGSGGDSTDIYNAAVAAIGDRVDGDLWSEGVRQLVNFAIEQTDGWDDRPNTNAQAALDRIESEVLSITAVGGAQDLIRKGICASLTNDFQQGWADEANMWDFIIKVRESFGFSFIPCVEKDAIVPFTPGLGGDYWREIDPSEYSRSSLSATFSERMYAYTTAVAVTSRHVCSSNWQAKAPTTRHVGAFSLPNWPPDKPSKLRSVEAPEWLTPRSAPAKDTSGAAGGVPDKGNTANTGAGQDEHSQEEQAFFDGGLGDHYAETVMHELLFAHRRGGIGGRFRLDIAPGSLVKINTIGERFTGVKDTVWAHVEAVDLHIGGGKAETDLSLIYLRSPFEHKNYTTPVHPVFQALTWMGRKLLDY